jgi:hypothetical protein
MGARGQYEIPAELKEAKERYEQRRNEHCGRRPISEPLWVLASELARQHGVFRTAQVLRLDYNKLKRRTQATASSAEKPTSASRPAFVELIAPSAALPCECVIEVDGPRGRMRIEWRAL